MTPTEDGAACLYQPWQIALLRLCTLKAGIKMEILGLRLSRGQSCSAIARKIVGGRSRRDVLARLEEHIAAEKAARGSA